MKHWLYRCGWFMYFTALSSRSLTAQAPAGQTSPTVPENTASTKTAFELQKNIVYPLTLPARIWNGLILVDSGVGVARRGYWIIDTGLNACTVTPESGKIFNLAPAGGKVEVAGFGGAHSVDQTEIPDVQFTTFKIQKLKVGLIDILAQLSPVSARRPEAPIGCLGTPFLSAFQVVLDYEKRYVALEAPATPFPKDKTGVEEGFELRDGRMYVKVAITGAKPFVAVLDTSAPITMIPTKVAQQAKLKPLEVIPFIQPGGGAGRVERVVLPKLSLGKASIEGANAIYVSPNTTKNFDPATAVLGLDFLRHFHVVINYTRHKLFLIPNAPPPSATNAIAEKDIGAVKDEAGKPTKNGKEH